MPLGVQLTEDHMTGEYDPIAEYHAAEAEKREAARRAEPLTCGELTDTLLALANDYASRRDHDGDLVCNVLLALRERLL